MVLSNEKNDLLTTYLIILYEWFLVFPQKRSWERAVRLSLSAICSFGRKTISRSILFSGREYVDWTADYRLFSRSNWKSSDLFRPILKRCLERSEGDFVSVAYDDTHIRKRGKKIPGVRWLRDTLSPVFCINIMWGMRFLQASFLLPLHQKENLPARAIPIQFIGVPPVKKPWKKAPEEEWKRYEEEKKQKNLSTYFVNQVRVLREEMNRIGYANKTLLAVVDGSYCNKTCLSEAINGIEIIGRTRKNAVLCKALKKRKKNSFYSKITFTPEEIRKDDKYSWSHAKIYHGGNWRELRYKEIVNIHWKSGSKRRPMRLIVVAPTPYRPTKKSRLHYRDPAYLLTTDLNRDVTKLLQAYFDRWQIEVNFKEEKDTFGVGEAQVWSKESVDRQPAFVVASYSTLLLSGVLCYGDKRGDDFFNLPKWRRRPPKRPSCGDLALQLRREIEKDDKVIEKFGLREKDQGSFYRVAA